MTIKTWHERLSAYYTSAEMDTAVQAENKELRARVAELEESNEAIRTAWEQERSVSDGLAQKLAALEAQEPLGTIAFYRHNVTQFYRNPKSPYLGNALDYRTVYLAAGAKHE